MTVLEEIFVRVEMVDPKAIFSATFLEFLKAGVIEKAAFLGGMLLEIFLRTKVFTIIELDLWVESNDSSMGGCRSSVVHK